MNSLGAIPKGGARPKTKPVTNGQIKKPDYNEQYKIKHKAKHNTNEERSVDFCYKNSNNTSMKNERENNNEVADFKDACKPLEEKEILAIENGVQIKRFALATEWVEKRLFLHYMRPPLSNLEGDYVIGAIDAWVEQMEFLVEDLAWLLKLPHHRFWCQMVYDKSVQECLEFYLTGGPRWYEHSPNEHNACAAVISEIHQLVFLIYVRMATYKETKEDHISSSVFGELIYNNYLFDACKFLDLCVSYGVTNGLLLTKMITNVFTCQPKYYDDLALMVLSLKGVLENLEKKLGIFDLLTPRFVNSEVTLTLDELEDIVHYMLDTFCSIRSFLHVFPKACETFHEKEFHLRLSCFYERAIPRLIEHLTPTEGEGGEDDVLRVTLLLKVDNVRLNALSIFREMISWFSITRDAHQEHPDLSKGIEHFTQILTSCLEEKVFVTDYNSLFWISGDLGYFQGKGADMTTLNFVQEAVDTIASEMDVPSHQQHVTTSDVINLLKEPNKSDDPSGMNGYYAGETSGLSTIEIESLVYIVKDLLPDLGIGFIKECLKYYNYSTEEVLNGFLEGNLPPSLNALDRHMPDKNDTLDKCPKEEELRKKGGFNTDEELSDHPSVLVNRVNVYDDDEFDVFRRPAKFDKNKFHKGKRKGGRGGGSDYEKDPELTEKMKSIIEQYDSSLGYSIYEDENKYTPIQQDYDDEYDDTYDDNVTGDVDNFGNDKRKGRRTMIGRGALNTPGLKFGEEEEEEEEEKKGGAWRNNPTQREDNERPNTLFKKANASPRRGNLPAESPWGTNSNHSSTGGSNARRSWKNTNEEETKSKNEYRGSGNGYRETKEAETGDYRNSNSGDYRNSNSGDFRNSKSGDYRNSSSGDYRNSNSGDYRNSNSGNYRNSNSNSQNDYRESTYSSANSYRNSNPDRRTHDYRESKPFVPFCENPELTRDRYETKRMNKQFRNKGYCSQPDAPSGPSGPPAGGESGAGPPSKGGQPRPATKSNRNSGKSWRQGGDGGEENDDSRPPHGGKYKEDTNHGKAQDKTFRHKMIHKNEQRRNAAQFKYRNNF